MQPSFDRRTFWFNPTLDKYDEYDAATLAHEFIVPTTIAGLEELDANLVSSRLYTPRSSLHAPVLDIDFAARLIPSSTEGHFHLYLDGLELTWAKYEKLLVALGEAGVIEQGYLDASLRRQMTMVRLPGVIKPAGKERRPETGSST